ncbi:PilN domain-containing protein [Methylomonas sp. SURF-2]|uniref:PilN domain-containing protein n=1 Tax=Methylomonas subterranea TaxID=2952225 RepID=A0ABT1TI12_9GAMM|nr:PilN domain-containing protein [Methylomonas sp. SURF-2]MCQ8105075.1 PilN domain-containing protein [Methylomonas sp. SURF-2]
MIQQVNLLRKDGRTDKTLLTNPYLLVSVSVCAIMLGISAYDTYQLQLQKQQHEQLEQQLLAATTRLTELQARFPRRTIDNTLLQALQQATQRQQNLSQILELLTDDQSDQALGFSRYLSALAEQAQPDVWLSRIRLDSTRNSLELEGGSFKPEQIPALLQGLQKSPAFNGRHFARLLMQQNPENSPQTDFSVSSSLKPEQEQDHVK